MSTFNGLVQEFPDIRIDFFRTIEGRRPPLACFLSHVHSDHLAGLESLKSPFIYCSSATKELLLRLERYPHRMNFAKGILESRKQHYKHLKKILKPIPLETPTEIELTPGRKIQVTLFDANHCTGAVMFLIENDSNAILYTGDIRSEPWFVSKLSRSPFLVEYSSGLKTLDCIYLDTSNAGSFEEFPTKAEGLAELLNKVSKYPIDTTFHFAAWTFGYEEVWMALSRALKSPIHVDSYRMGLYQSLRGNSIVSGGKEISGPALAHEGSILAGHKCGNAQQPGILTDNQEVKLHSCEKGTPCSALASRNVVWIQPIVCREAGKEIAEIGIGGGGGDLNQNAELELDAASVEFLMGLFEPNKVNRSVIDEVQRKLLKGLHSSLKSMSLADSELNQGEGRISFDELPNILIRAIQQKNQEDSDSRPAARTSAGNASLPKTIRFPYSRHSSHSELCDIVKAFRPADIYPCTVDEESWHEGISIEAMFGEYCSKSIFRHDLEMRSRPVKDEDEEDEDADMVDTQASHDMSDDLLMPPPNSVSHRHDTFGSSGGQKINSHTAERRGSVQSIAGLHTPVNSESTVAATPDSSSQSRRRKAVDEAVGGAAKRVRTSGSPLPSNRGEADSRHADDEADADPDPDSDPDSSDTDNEAGPSTYFDVKEQVHRCGVCHWELWMPGGSCTSCELGIDLYEEHILPVDTDEPRLFLATPLNLTHNQMKIGTDENIDNETYKHLSERYLDLASSAYSDEDDDRSSGYEMNSMIDDDSIASGESDVEDRKDWKTKHDNLRRAYEALLDQNRVLQEQLIRALEPSFDSDDAEDHEGYDEDDIRAIDIQVQDPQLAEIIVQQSSSESELNQQMDSSSDVEDFEEISGEALELDSNDVFDL